MPYLNYGGVPWRRDSVMNLRKRRKRWSTCENLFFSRISTVCDICDLCGESLVLLRIGYSNGCSKLLFCRYWSFLGPETIRCACRRRKNGCYCGHYLRDWCDSCIGNSDHKKVSVWTLWHYAKPCLILYLKISEVPILVFLPNRNLLYSIPLAGDLKITLDQVLQRLSSVSRWKAFMN